MGTRTKVAVVDNVRYQWSPSGSYRLEHMLKTISNLPNRFHLFSQKNYAIYVIDDYAVHLMPEVRKALYQRGCVLVGMVGRITGFIQAIDTHLHRASKNHYINAKMALMLEKLEVDKNKIPSPTQEEMVKLLHTAWKETIVDFAAAFKSLFVTSALDGSDNYLVSDRLFDLIGEAMKRF